LMNLCNSTRIYYKILLVLKAFNLSKLPLSSN